MKLAIVYTDKRAQYLSQGCSVHCEVVEYDLSFITLRWWQKILSAVISYHGDRKLWQNDFYRNPLSVYFRKALGDAFIKRNSVKVDAVLQFGVMTPYNRTLFGNATYCLYHDGAYDQDNPNWFCPRYGGWFAKMQQGVFHNADLIFTFSKWARNQHINQYGLLEQKVFEVGWGPCLPLKNELSQLRNSARRFVFIGNDPWVKGLDLLLSAFQRVHNEYPDTRLDIIGINQDQGSSYSVYGIHMHGPCPPNEVLQILTRSDILVLPSRYERAGHVTIEAMWYGLPVIVSDIFGSPEPLLSGSCGIITTPGSIVDLTQAMLDLVEHPEIVMNMSEKAMVEARRNWTWDKVGERIIQEIERSLK